MPVSLLTVDIQWAGYEADKKIIENIHFSLEKARSSGS